MTAILLFPATVLPVSIPNADILIVLHFFPLSDQVYNLKESADDAGDKLDMPLSDFDDLLPKLRIGVLARVAQRYVIGMLILSKCICFSCQFKLSTPSSSPFPVQFQPCMPVVSQIKS